jgi:hypothetical protein
VADVEQIRQRLPELVTRLSVDDEEIAALSEKAMALGTGQPEELRARWRILFAAALAASHRPAVRKE